MGHCNKIVPSILLIFFWVVPLVSITPILAAYNNYNYDYNYYNNYNHHGNLDLNYYDRSCPNLLQIVRYGVMQAVRADNRMAASLLRLHFHDCFVDGCDASILLDDTIEFTGEKNALPNRNSVRGYEVIDNIKAEVEKTCPLTVSCSDILTLVSREAVVLSGGLPWPVWLGRKDGLSASEKSANEQLPSPIESLEKITTKFTSKGLDLKDVVVLSGAHTIGYAQCFTFKNRLFNFQGSGKPDPTLEATALTNLQDMCPNRDASNTNLAPLDATTTYRFDNVYYSNIVNNTALLQSDQALLEDPNTASLVQSYSTNSFLFLRDFAASMVKLSSLGVLTGQDGQIRQECGSVN